MNPGQTADTGQQAGFKYGKLLGVLLLILGVAALFYFFPVKRYLFAALDWIKNLGPWGPVVLVLGYIVSCLLFLPGSLLTIGAGFLFGLGWGTVTVSAGSTLGAVAAFLVGRTLARDWIARRIAQNKTFAAIDEAIGREGFKFVLLLRLSPLFPFNLLNYALGLTKVSTAGYVLGSWLGMLPGTVMYVYFGSAARSLTEAAAGGSHGGAAQSVFFWTGLAASVAAAGLITRVAGRNLKSIRHDN